MANEDKIVVDGTVEEALPNAQFVVKLAGDQEDIRVTATISGKIRMNNIRILPGDRVKLELSPYDIGKGRITYRYRENESSSIS